MTHDEIKALSDDELDALVATGVMGWRRHGFYLWRDASGKAQVDGRPYHPTRDATQAIAALREKDCGYVLQRDLEEGQERCLLHDKDNQILTKAACLTIERAICEALVCGSGYKQKNGLSLFLNTPTF